MAFSYVNEDSKNLLFSSKCRRKHRSGEDIPSVKLSWDRTCNMESRQVPLPAASQQEDYYRLADFSTSRDQKEVAHRSALVKDCYKQPLVVGSSFLDFVRSLAVGGHILAVGGHILAVEEVDLRMDLGQGLFQAGRFHIAAEEDNSAEVLRIAAEEVRHILAEVAPHIEAVVAFRKAQIASKRFL